MEREPIPLAVRNCRPRVNACGTISSASLTEAHRRFLLGLVAGAPPWDAMKFRHLEKLPAVNGSFKISPA